MFLKNSLTSVRSSFVKPQSYTGLRYDKFHFLAYKLIGLSLLTMAVSVQAATVTVNVGASKDATIAGVTNPLEDSTYANGGGSRLLVGVDEGITHRSLLEFDLAAAGIQAGSHVESVTMKLTLGRATPGVAPQPFSFHTVNQEWLQGPIGLDVGDGGHVKQQDDVTWDYARWHPIFPTPWNDGVNDLYGGNFSSTSSASSTFSPSFIGSTFTWSSEKMEADVQAWVNAPATNHGWLIKSDAASLVGFWSKEGGVAQGNAELAPTLVINYTPIPEPEMYAMLLAGLGLIGAMTRRKRRMV
jgi:hypothetical protein